ncbi:hypothetical protein NC653_037499 [Populus alba x Populus x berolinensis]|uniref:Uncharacterized protein n=1 Tax=Populus alba x Populus x berolinensis TaxID=444605 RepID=A0AAD6LEH3_9ROSI|nr:hypothetical protein NC653_037498 [Populus alba x Populus x berolinensis]KAJ6959207.1 hypothetical protein NC653_037499 [Populus alba x Populus x berolinensis]
MTMIPGCGATIFSSPPLCRARGLSFFFPLCSVLFLFSLSGFAGVGNANGGGMGCCRGNEAGRRCLLQFVFFSRVQRCKPLFLCISLPLNSLPLLLSFGR